MLVLAVVSSLMFVGCLEKPKDEPKIVAEQYRGIFETEHNIGFFKIILTENTCQLLFYNSNNVINSQRTNTAWTVEDKLFFDWGGDIGIKEEFTFTDNNSFYYYLDEANYHFLRVNN